MRIAAGIILLILGATGVVAGMLALLAELLSPVGFFHPWAALAVVVLLVGAGIVGGGISAIRRRFFWWPLMAAICLVILAITYTILIMSSPTMPWDERTFAQRLLGTVPIWGGGGLPSLLALIFLVKRRAEFQA